MKLQKFKEEKKNQKNIILFTIACVLLITGVFLYKTFANFQIIENEDLINGDVSDPGDIYFAFYKDNKIQKDMPTKEQGYVLDEEKSYCGITGGSDSNIKVHVTEDNMIHVSGVTTSRTKCNLYFVKGIYLLGKGIPFALEGEDGLYEVKHDDNELDENWKAIEYRYAGNDPDNYIRFNDEDWQIIGLVNVETSEGKVEQRVKIIRKDSIGKLPWDTADKNNWLTSSLKTLLNEGDYYKRTNNYSSNGLLDISKFMIDTNVIWNLGAYDTYLDITPTMAYQKERDNSNNQSEWKTEGNLLATVGLIYPSDYGYATSKKTECLTIPMFQWNDKIYNCYKNDWLSFLSSENDTIITDYYWTLISYTGHDNSVFRISNVGHLGFHANSNVEIQVFPVVYLRENNFIFKGNGDAQDPFQLALHENY